MPPSLWPACRKYARFQGAASISSSIVQRKAHGHRQGGPPSKAGKGSAGQMEPKRTDGFPCRRPSLPRVSQTEALVAEERRCRRVSTGVAQADRFVRPRRLTKGLVQIARGVAVQIQ